MSKKRIVTEVIILPLLFTFLLFQIVKTYGYANYLLIVLTIVFSIVCLIKSSIFKITNSIIAIANILLPILSLFFKNKYVTILNTTFLYIFVIYLFILSLFNIYFLIKGDALSTYIKNSVFYLTSFMFIVVLYFM